jgi:hypothetical protein
MKSGKLKVRCPCKPALLKAVATEIAKYKIDFPVAEEFRLNKVGHELAVDFTFLF